MQRLILIVILILFSALSAVALLQHGYAGIFAVLFQNSAGWQVLADLVIALMLFLAWMWQDARKTGRNPWPWALITLTLGSFGPLLYLLFRGRRE